MITRFPPSPTGFLHVGGLRTALYNYLLAKRNGGKFILRIEDTDRARLVGGAVENIVHTLSWAGITIDEGVLLHANGDIVQQGDAAPYIQSERKEQGLYKKYIDQLLDSGHAYYAFDSAADLDAMRERQQAMKQPTRYDRDNMINQFTLSESKLKERLDAGETYVIRLNMPRTGVTSWVDLIRGKVEFQNELIDDQILMKSDGFPTYHFAVVVDDHHMGVTHVIRGEEWVSSVPKHIALYNAFGWELPTFGHLPLLVNEQKQKLSKRHGDVAVEDFKEKGYLPEALINFIAFLGWNPGDEREIMSLKELEAEFSMEKVGKSAAVFNYTKLDWYNKQYMMNLPIEDIVQRAIPFLINAGHLKTGELSGEELDQIQRIVSLEIGRAHTLKELADSLGFMFATTLVYDPELLIWKKGTKESTTEHLQKLVSFLQEYTGKWEEMPLQESVMSWIKENGWGNGDVLWPMRVALSGQKNSPGPFEIAAVLGKEKTLERITAAVENLK